ncbi:MAG: transcriptional regulator [Rhodospirillaceae bacterium]|nr:transcriptional regulator [Rhodospirillaceae bacterium]
MTKGYGQFCPVAKAAELFCERWNALLLRELGAGASHFSQIQRGVPLMSPSMLSRRLKELEREGVIERDGATYRLTEAGREFLPLVDALGVWGQRWTRRQLKEDEVDFRLLIWDMERTVKADAFGPGRTVVQLEFADLPAGKSLWWFINEQSAVQLCLEDPGYEVDLFLSITVRDMIYVWRGDLGVERALDEERLEAHGAPRFREALRSWFNLSRLAEIPSARRDPQPV